MTIRPFTLDDIPAIKAFTDRSIGRDYYSVTELEEIYAKSVKDGRVASLVLEDESHAIRGVRITYPPGNWKKGKGKGLNPQLWKVPQESAAYFQSLFIDTDLTGHGWGRKMSEASLLILKDLGTRAVVCHSWKESPNDSSGRYLRGLGFEVVETHPLYWKDVDYVCTRCGKPCLCTAEEMIKYL